MHRRYSSGPIPTWYLLGLWCLSSQTSCGLLVPTPQGDVVAASDTRLRRVPEPVPATPPATSTPAVIPPASGIKVGDGAGDGTDDVLLRAVSPSSTEFVKFVKRRKAAQGSVVLDLRPNTDFDRREHFVGATSIPADELAARLLELPPPFVQPLSIKGNDEVSIVVVLITSEYIIRL